MNYLKEELKKKLPYGNKVGFKTDDGIWRFRDPGTGLWRRYMTMLNKEGKAQKGWGSTGEIIGEKKDMHFVTTNGIKVFMFPKKEIKK